tara:strand:+ start:2881 stop:4287 length:1407 start_codon:yes stop_codon:yes gene_type:complete
LKPSDARAWSSCFRRVWLDNKGDFEQEPIEGFDQLVIDLGLAHEQTVLARLSANFEVHTAASVADTERLMKQGVDVIYQAQLFDEKNSLIGNPDFLIRHENEAYQPADAKLSLSELKKEIQVQLGFYRLMLGTELPGIVFLGDGREALIGDEANAVTHQFVTEMRVILNSPDEPMVRYSHSKCLACPYYNHCKPGFVEKDELSLLYGVQGRSAAGLEALGIDTISRLAATDPGGMADVPYLKGSKKDRAVLQARSWFDGKVYQFGDVVLPVGQWVHFDIEDNPLTASGEKHVYLWGFLVPDYGDDQFETVWTDSDDQDYAGWLGFLGKVEGYQARYPELVLAHYSSHERSTIASYARRYCMEEHETVRYLLGDDSPLFDLQKPVLESLVLPLQAYGLKDICKHPDLVDFQWQDEESGSQWSVVQFHRFLQEEDGEERAALKDAILGYNRDDVKATYYLERWLRAQFVH